MGIEDGPRPTTGVQEATSEGVRSRRNEVEVLGEREIVVEPVSAFAVFLVRDVSDIHNDV